MELYGVLVNWFPLEIISSKKLISRGSCARPLSGEPCLTCNEHHRSPVKSPDVLAAGSWPRLDIRWFSNVTYAGRRLVFACMTSLLVSDCNGCRIVYILQTGARCDRFVISRSRVRICIVIHDLLLVTNVPSKMRATDLITPIDSLKCVA